MEKWLVTTVVRANFGATQGMQVKWSNTRKEKHQPEDKQKGAIFQQRGTITEAFHSKGKREI